MRECYLLLAVVAVMMFHGMMEESAIDDSIDVKQGGVATGSTNKGA